MYLIISLSEKDYLIEWHKELYIIIILVFCFSIFSITGIFLMIRILTRMDNELTKIKKLEETERRRRAGHEKLNEIASLAHLTQKEQLEAVLQVGSNILKLPFGFISKIEKDEYNILVNNCKDLGIENKTKLQETLCSITIEEGDVVFLRDIGKSEHNLHPEYKKLKIETYAGAPVFVAGQIYGTIHFASFESYAGDFHEIDIEFLRLLARWTGSVIEKNLIDQKLIESEMKFKTIVETEPECVKVLSAEGHLLQMNQAGLNMIEADHENQVVGKNISSIIAPEYRDAFNNLRDIAINEGKSGVLEFEIIGLKGGRRTLETHSVPLRDASGSITGVLSVTRDITQKKIAEKNLLQAKAEAEVASLAKSCNSHDLI